MSGFDCRPRSQQREKSILKFRRSPQSASAAGTWPGRSARGGVRHAARGCTGCRRADVRRWRPGQRRPRRACVVRVARIERRVDWTRPWRCGSGGRGSRRPFGQAGRGRAALDARHSTGSSARSCAPGNGAMPGFVEGLRRGARVGERAASGRAAPTACWRRCVPAPRIATGGDRGVRPDGALGCCRVHGGVACWAVLPQCSGGTLLKVLINSPGSRSIAGMQVWRRQSEGPGELCDV